MSKTTKKKLNELYKKPVDPLKPFERLETLMKYAIQKLNDLRKNDERR
jgi:hypothetical protein